MTRYDNVNVVLFDFGGVIAEEGFRDGLELLATQQGLNPQEMFSEGMCAAYESGYVLGTGTETNFWDQMRRRTGLQGSDIDLTETILARFVIRPWMVNLVNKLNQHGYRTAILSDQTDWLDRLDARQHFMRLFADVFVSYRLGKGKRDASIFKDIAGYLAMAPHDLLFIDDDRGNIERAAACGWNALLYEDRTQLERELAPLFEATREKPTTRVGSSE